MQIKRFEAVDMTDALRLVKREFGDDAVILSAKEVRPRGFFSALRKKHVEITAATDDPTDDAQGGNDFTGLLAQQLDDTSPVDHVSLSTPAWTKKVIESETQPFPQPRVALEEQALHAEKNIGLTQQQPTPEAASPVEEIANPQGSGTQPYIDMAAANGIMRDPDTDDLAVQPFFTDSEKRKIIAVVGPSGAGKSTALAKLAWHCQVVERKRIGLISLDRFRMAANRLLEKVAHIMSLPLTVVQDANGMQTALKDLNDVDFVLIDTPGMGHMDAAIMDKVSRLLRLADPDETHLVLNATLRDDVLSSTVEGFSSVNPDHLLPTHLDECGSLETISKLMEKTHMAASFYADGLDLMDALKETTLDRINTPTPQPAPVGARVTAFPAKKAHQENESAVSSDAIGTARYLANRNSELFHHPTCKSVKRINAENIAAFSSIEQAIDKGFKPCRACCNVSAVKKTVTGSSYDQRARAM